MLMALLLTLGAGQHASAVRTPSIWEVKGVVVSTETGKPVEGALVELLRYEGLKVDVTLTDEDGAFVLTGDDRGPYVVRVRHLGFATWRSSDLYLDAGKTTTLRVPLSVAAIQLPDVDVLIDRCGVSTAVAETAEALYAKVRVSLSRIARNDADTTRDFHYHTEEEITVPMYDEPVECRVDQPATQIGSVDGASRRPIGGDGEGPPGTAGGLGGARDGWLSAVPAGDPRRGAAPVVRRRSDVDRPL